MSKSCPYLKSNSHREKNGLKKTFEIGAGFGRFGRIY
jgi:hypothetical protein